MLKRKLIPAVLSLLLAATGNIANAAEYVSAKFAPKEHPIRTVLLLPAQVHLTKTGTKGKEGLANESDAFAEQLTTLIVKQLEAKNIKIAPNPFTEEALKRNEEVRATLTRLQMKYDTLSVQLHAKPEEVRKGRYSLGDEVANLGLGAGTDAIVFIRATGAVLGKKVPKVIRLQVPDTLKAFISFVDSHDGDVLAIVDFVSRGDFQEKTEQVMGKTLANSHREDSLLDELSQLSLEPDTNPAARTFQQAIFAQSIPLAAFEVSDMKKEDTRLKGLESCLRKNPARRLRRSRQRGAGKSPAIGPYSDLRCVSSVLGVREKHQRASTNRCAASLVRQLRGPHFKHTAVMQQAAERGVCDSVRLTFLETVGCSGRNTGFSESEENSVSSGDSGEAERSFRREAERHSGMIPNTIGA